MLFFTLTFLVSFRLAVAQSTCMFALLGCPGSFSSDNCVEQYCKYDCSPKCCALSTLSEIRSCLGGTTPTQTDPNFVACGTAISIISACQTIIPTFSAASTAEIKACLCYENDGTFYPQPFDNGISACDRYFTTAQPTLVPVAESYLGFCTANEGVASTPAAASSTVPPSVAASSSVLSAPKGQATGSQTSSPVATTTASTQASSASPASTSSKSSSPRLSIEPEKVIMGLIIPYTLLLLSVL